jgi:hypothetical protein
MIAVGIVLTMPVSVGIIPTMNSRDLVRVLKDAGWYEDRGAAAITFSSMQRNQVIYRYPTRKRT